MNFNHSCKVWLCRTGTISKMSVIGSELSKLCDKIASTHQHYLSRGVLFSCRKRLHCSQDITTSQMRQGSEHKFHILDFQTWTQFSIKMILKKGITVTFPERWVPKGKGIFEKYPLSSSFITLLIEWNWYLVSHWNPSIALHLHSNMEKKIFLLLLLIFSIDLSSLGGPVKKTHKSIDFLWYVIIPGTLWRGPREK